MPKPVEISGLTARRTVVTIQINVIYLPPDSQRLWPSDFPKPMKMLERCLRLLFLGWKVPVPVPEWS